MTGPEHYRRAEELLRAVEPDARHGNGSPVVYDQPETLAAAQVHATLALAAATATLDAYEGPGGGSATGRSAEDGNAWREALEGGASQ